MAEKCSPKGRLVLQNVCAEIPCDKFMPDFIRRRILRSRISSQLRALYALSSEEQLQCLVEYIKYLKQMPISTDDHDAVREEHYELPAAVFKLIFGKRLKYSCVLYPTSSSTLDEAEEAMLELYCERAQIRGGLSILDIGGGYGGFALYVAQKFPSSHVTSLSYSKSMKDYIDEQCKLQGIDNVTAVNADIVTYESAPVFDRVTSIQTIEHFKNYDKLFKKISGFMKPDALFFVELGCHKQFAYHVASDQKEAIVIYDSQQSAPDESFFRAESIVAENILLYFQEDLTIMDHWRVNGMHQARGCEARVKNINKNYEKLISILREYYGDEKKAVQAIKDNRNTFLAWSEILSFNGGQEWFCAHQLFKKKV